MVGHELPHRHASCEAQAAAHCGVGFGRVGPPGAGAGADGHAAGGRVVDRFDEAARTHAPVCCDSPEVAAGLSRRDEQCQGAGVGSDHDVVGQPAFQAQPWHAEGPVLIVHLHIVGVVA